MCSHRPRLYHCTYFENIVIISYYIIHDILYRTRVHAAYSVFSHICQCPRDIQTHYNALYYFFRCCSQQEFGQCLILQYRTIFSECRKRRRQIMMTIIKNLEQRKYILSRSAVSWSRSATSRNVHVPMNITQKDHIIIFL